MPRYVDLHLFLLKVHLVLPPLLLPLQGLEAHGEGASHLDCLADGQGRSGFVVEEPENLAVQINRGAAELNLGHVVVLLHGDALNFLLKSFISCVIFQNSNMESLSLIIISNILRNRVVQLTNNRCNLQYIKSFSSS